MSWGVVLHNDNVNTFATVGYALHRVLALAPADVDPLVSSLQDEGSVDVLTGDEREQVEQVARRLRVYGLQVRVEAV